METETKTKSKRSFSSHDDYFLGTRKQNHTKSIDFIAISVQMFLNATNQKKIYIFISMWTFQSARIRKTNCFKHTSLCRLISIRFKCAFDHICKQSSQINLTQVNHQCFGHLCVAVNAECALQIVAKGHLTICILLTKSLNYNVIINL